MKSSLHKMENQDNLEDQSLKDRPWTTDEIRKHSSNWTLAGDVGLFNLLNEFSHHIISRTHEVENSVDFLVHQTKMTAAKINNVINDFHMLSNLQFVENRVYDEEIKESIAESKPVAEKSKEQKEAEMLPKIVQAIELGLAVLDTAFDRINFNEISDSEDEDISSEGRTILEPKDPYENRPLPYIIGSEEFMKCDYAGLKDLIDDDASLISGESCASETEETSSDEGEMLPLDDDRFSRKPIDAISQNISDKISSSDDESELFGSEKEVNGFDSETSLEFKSKEKNIQRASADPLPEKETRKSSVASLQTKLRLPQVLPVPKIQENQKDDLFKDHSDDESPFRKKAGLFVSDIKFKDEKDDDLFGEDLFGNSESENVKEVKPVETSKTASKKPSSILPEARKPTLFDNEDSEDDIFDTLMKTKKSTNTKIVKESKPSKPVEKSETSSLFDDTEAAGSQDSSEKADTLSTPSSAPSTKPSGNAFDFVTGVGNNGSLFGDDSDADDLFSSKKSQGKKFDFDSSENDDLFNTINSKPPKESKILGGIKSSLFEDKKLSNQQEEKETEKLVKKKTTLTFFEDSDSSDQEKENPTVSKSVDNKKEISLFGDDDLEDNIFNKVTKEPSKVVDKSETSSHFNDTEIVKKTKPGKPVEKSETSSLFDDTEVVISSESKSLKSVEKSKISSLFDDTEEESTEILPSVSKVQQSKLPSLFEDSDNFDLFAPKPLMKQSKPAEFSSPIQALKPVVNAPKDEEVDGSVTSKVSLLPKDADVDNEISFDTLIDSSNILNVINKSRVKVAVKRRKPTRQGRLAALESSEKEAKGDSATSTKADLDSLVVGGSDSFSTSLVKTAVNSEAPKLDYKSQEKKKMNIMSQLISEVATSKVALKKSAEKEEDDEEDKVDIFSETTKDKSKSSFSFKSPEENGIASMFLDEKEDKDDVNVSKSDSLDDDFFTEPAFQNFRSSISHKDSVLDLESDEDDDLFSAIKTVLPKVKDSSDSNELFDDTDIFVDAQKEKYEMFPNQVYDEDDDIFSNPSNTVSNKLSSKTSSIKKVETKQVNAFDDPLTGLLEE